MTSLPPLPFEDRRDYALARLLDGSLVLPAAPLRYKSGDSEYRYRPDSELFYMTGWSSPDAVAVLRGFAEGGRFILFVPEPDPDVELWSGPRLALEEVRERYGADEVLPASELEARLPELLLGGDRIYYRLGASERCDGLVRRALTRGRSRRFRSGVGPQLVADPGAILDPMRLRKDEAEVARMKAAARVTVEAFRHASSQVRPGVGEWEIEALLDGGFRRGGAVGPAFATIVGAGRNACTLHYIDNACRIAEGDLVLMDAGAEWEYYAADVTRTVPASGRFEGLKRAVYETVLAAQRAALSACVPGTTMDRVHEAAVRALVAGLVDLGAVEGPTDDAVEGEAYRAYYPHRTSHWLGLDTHDPGMYRSPGGPTVLEPGMAFTVEPGLYFRSGSCPAVPELEGIGVRIEDDVVITPDGCDVLTAALPTDPDEVAALVSSGR